MIVFLPAPKRWTERGLAPDFQSLSKNRLRWQGRGLNGVARGFKREGALLIKQEGPVGGSALKVTAVWHRTGGQRADRHNFTEIIADTVEAGTGVNDKFINVVWEADVIVRPPDAGFVLEIEDGG